MDSPVDLNPLERGQLHVMRIQAAIRSAVLLVPAAIGDFALREQGVPLGAIVVPVLLIAIWSVFFAAYRRWRSWGYALADDELHIAFGWWTRVHTVVPLGRVQHIDVTQGPVERPFRVAKLIVHTAGTDHSVVVLPGITREAAEGMRDVIRGHIRSMPW